MKNIDFKTAKAIMDQKLGEWKIMALASCADDYPMVRNVSCIFYNDKIYFKTDRNFRKTKQLFQNPRVAMMLQRRAGRRHLPKTKDWSSKRKVGSSKRNIRNICGRATMRIHTKTVRSLSR